MSRELDGLMAKLDKINLEMGGDEGKKKKKDAMDRFHELKTQVGERLHRLKFVRCCVLECIRCILQHVEDRICKIQKRKSIEQNIHEKQFDDNKKYEKIYDWLDKISMN